MSLADKMFEKLGYKKVDNKDANEVILYEDKVQDCKIYHSAGYFGKNIKVCGAYEPMNFNDNEILACAQLVREIRGDDNELGK